MIIGPGEPRRPEKPPKDVKKAKAKKRRRAERDAAAAASAEARSVPETEGATVGAPDSRATGPAEAAASLPRTAGPLALDIGPTPVGVDAPGPPAAGTAGGAAEVPTPSGLAARTPARAVPGPGSVPLTDRIDGLRGRVDELLALVDAAAATGDATTVADTPTADATLNAEVTRSADATPTPTAAAADAGVPTAASSAATAGTSESHRSPAPPSSAVLVARELLGAGMDVAGVRTRLRDAYGVADPDAVLAGVGSR